MQPTQPLWNPPPPLLVSDWADEHRRLSMEASGEPGRWRTSRAPYQKAIMDAFNDPKIHTIVLMTSAQIGKTEMVNNMLGYLIDQDPSPALLLQPTLELAGSWSKDRFAPMVRDTPVLQDKVHDAKSRESSNTILHKSFTGGHITMAGANSPASLASRPVRVVFCDEVDRYPTSAGTEGDPISLAIKRTTTFHRKKAVLASTPTIKGASRIESLFEISDQRRYCVPCPECSTLQPLEWEHLIWHEGETENTHYQCAHCQYLIKHSKKQALLAQGQWIAQADFRGIAGFHLNELYSPWVLWSNIVDDYLKARTKSETYQTWTNTALGLSWDVIGESLPYEPLMARREIYSAEVPQSACVLTAGVDVQDNRLEVHIDGWGDAYERWVIDYQILWGCPVQASVWDALDELLRREFKHESGHTLKIVSAFIDSGGHFTSEVYRYAQARRHLRVFAVKGRSTIAEPLVAQSRNLGGMGYLIGTDTAKALFYSRLALEDPQGGYCHFPMHLNSEYFKQLTSEQRVKKDNHFVWKRVHGRRNEALDTAIYSLACAEALRPHFDILQERLKPLDTVDEPKRATIPNYRHMRKKETEGGFVNAWRS